MNRLTMKWLTIAMLWMLGTAQAQATPEQTIRTLADQALQTLQNERDTLRDDPLRIAELMDTTLGPHVDFPRIARLVLGRHWREASSAQRDRFSQVFRHHLVRFYAAAFERFVREQGLPDAMAIDILRSTRDERTAIVTSVFRATGQQPVPVDYRLLLSNDEQWRIYDVQVEGISLVQSYRSTFDERVQQVGVEGLIEELERSSQ